MAGACPVPGPDDPLVRSLSTVVDCNVQDLVRAGYSTLFEPSGAFAAVLTALMTLYVAFIGISLLLGRTQLSVSELVLTVVKLGAVLALATQWNTYQTVVYQFLFEGPQQLATAMLQGAQGGRPLYQGQVFDGLQIAFDRLTAAATAYAKSAPVSASPLVGGPSSGAMMLTLSATTLLLSSLGVLLAAKVVLGLLLAVGPVFIALLLFDSTRGLFEGWLRASLAFAFAPLAATLVLGVALTMLEPTLVQLADLGATGRLPIGPVYSVLILVLVFAGVSMGLLIAGGMIAGGFRLPSRTQAAAAAEPGAQGAAAQAASWTQPRAVRIAAAASALERREAVTLAGAPAFTPAAAVSDRRTSSTTVNASVERGPRADAALAETRLGQGARRSAGPRTSRASRRIAR